MHINIATHSIHILIMALKRLFIIHLVVALAFTNLFAQDFTTDRYRAIVKKTSLYNSSRAMNNIKKNLQLFEEGTILPTHIAQNIYMHGYAYIILPEKNCKNGFCEDPEAAIALFQSNGNMAGVVHYPYLNNIPFVPEKILNFEKDSLSVDIYGVQSILDDLGYKVSLKKYKSNNKEWIIPAPNNIYLRYNSSEDAIIGISSADDLSVILVYYFKLGKEKQISSIYEKDPGVIQFRKMIEGERYKAPKATISDRVDPRVERFKRIMGEGNYQEKEDDSADYVYLGIDEKDPRVIQFRKMIEGKNYKARKNNLYTDVDLRVERFKRIMGERNTKVKRNNDEERVDWFSTRSQAISTRNDLTNMIEEIVNSDHFAQYYTPYLLNIVTNNLIPSNANINFKGNKAHIMPIIDPNKEKYIYIDSSNFNENRYGYVYINITIPYQKILVAVDLIYESTGKWSIEETKYIKMD